MVIRSLAVHHLHRHKHCNYCHKVKSLEGGCWFAPASVLLLCTDLLDAPGCVATFGNVVAPLLIVCVPVTAHSRHSARIHTEAHHIYTYTQKRRLWLAVTKGTACNSAAVVP